eukprot:TRINITY_DN8714_c0_g2_i1.p1 TRINITY_DN8714_c0_g2~~TRINITY_DN8714_c0_g2_i1.p1  ORF type:complete len:929 (+),score=190.35 TRINITY_DN8714_c0_g2_i1:104-2890(+)
MEPDQPADDDGASLSSDKDWDGENDPEDDDYRDLLGFDDPSPQPPPRPAPPPDSPAAPTPQSPAAPTPQSPAAPPPQSPAAPSSDARGAPARRDRAESSDGGARGLADGGKVTLPKWLLADVDISSAFEHVADPFSADPEGAVEDVQPRPKDEVAPDRAVLLESMRLRGHPPWDRLLGTAEQVKIQFDYPFGIAPPPDRETLEKWRAARRDRSKEDARPGPGDGEGAPSHRAAALEGGMLADYPLLRPAEPRTPSTTDSSASRSPSPIPVPGGPRIHPELDVKLPAEPTQDWRHYPISRRTVLHIPGALANCLRFFRPRGSDRRYALGMWEGPPSETSDRYTGAHVDTAQTNREVYRHFAEYLWPKLLQAFSGPPVAVSLRLRLGRRLWTEGLVRSCCGEGEECRTTLDTLFEKLEQKGPDAMKGTAFEVGIGEGPWRSIAADLQPDLTAESEQWVLYMEDPEGKELRVTCRADARGGGGDAAAGEVRLALYKCKINLQRLSQTDVVRPDAFDYRIDCRLSMPLRDGEPLMGKTQEVLDCLRYQPASSSMAVRGRPPSGWALTAVRHLKKRKYRAHGLGGEPVKVSLAEVVLLRGRPQPLRECRLDFRSERVFEASAQLESTKRLCDEWYAAKLAGQRCDRNLPKEIIQLCKGFLPSALRVLNQVSLPPVLPHRPQDASQPPPPAPAPASAPSPPRQRYQPPQQQPPLQPQQPQQAGEGSDGSADGPEPPAADGPPRMRMVTKRIKRMVPIVRKRRVLKGRKTQQLKAELPVAANLGGAQGAAPQTAGSRDPGGDREAPAGTPAAPAVPAGATATAAPPAAADGNGAAKTPPPEEDSGPAAKRRRIAAAEAAPPGAAAPPPSGSPPRQRGSPAGALRRRTPEAAATAAAAAVAARAAAGPAAAAAATAAAGGDDGSTTDEEKDVLIFE